MPIDQSFNAENNRVLRRVREEIRFLCGSLRLKKLISTLNSHI
jgi:hypothetical protein